MTEGDKILQNLNNVMKRRRQIKVDKVTEREREGERKRERKKREKRRKREKEREA